MPRDHFDGTGLPKVRMWAGYLLLTENRLPAGGVNYKTAMDCIARQLAAGRAPKYRDAAEEHRYFVYGDLDAHYEAEGRMFRHLMGMCAFFGFVSSRSKQKKVFNYDKCREYYLADDAVLTPVARNNLVMLNVRDNDFIRSLSGVCVDEKTDYRPTYAILHYAADIGRPVTKFELAVLLGRIDALKTEAEILARALAVGNELPQTQREQVPFFFAQMGWQTADGVQFAYAASQEPDFKFNTYLLLMQDLGLLRQEPLTGAYTPTAYAAELLAGDVPYQIADLERLLAVIDDYEGENKELNDLILYQRNPELLRAAQADAQFLQKMNFRSIRKPVYGKDGKRQRSRLIAELAKIAAGYECQYEQRGIFKMPNGNYYCEAHHIIEFSTEDGPDILNNLVVLGPAAHMMLHHACAEEVDDVYRQLLANGALPFARFREMAEVYACLTPAHVGVLHSRRIITRMQKDELLALLAAQ